MTQTTRRGRPRDTAADAAILRAALDIFIERGVEGTSIEQIAKRAGVGKLTVYRRWSNKEELLAQAIESARAAVPDLPPESDTVPVAEIVRAALPAAAELAADPRFVGLIGQVFASRTSHPTLIDTYWRHYVEPRRAATRALLHRAQAEGSIDADADLDVLIDMMVGALIFRMMQPGRPDREETERYLEKVYRATGLLSGK